MKVGELCNANVVTVSADTKLSDAALALSDNRVDALVVVASCVERPTAIGVISDRDILRVALEHPDDFQRLRVIDILSRTPVVLNQDEEIGAALVKLEAGNARFAPVIGPGGTLRGAISSQALLHCCDSGPGPNRAGPTQVSR